MPPRPHFLRVQQEQRHTPTLVLRPGEAQTLFSERERSGLIRFAPLLLCNSRNCSQAARVVVDELPREAFGVRPACWRCRKAGVVRKREQAPRTPNASRSSVAALPRCAFALTALFCCLPQGCTFRKVTPNRCERGRM